MEIDKSSFQGVFAGKKVLVTGASGFKGSWLCLWLSALGAKVTGFSLYLPSQPCNFSVSRVGRRIDHIRGDIRDLRSLKSVFRRARPEIVFHCAAQPIVRKSFDEPRLTFETNLMGTVNTLECLGSSGAAAAVIVTSDKCYRNREWDWGYRENDELGGEDPYSASKACAELAFRTYSRSFFRGRGACRIASARAGNVIGGGDWAADRIIPDCVRAWRVPKKVAIRNPGATRPWQHVLEPLSGYLTLAAALLNRPCLHGESFNFGPDPSVKATVRELISEFAGYFRNARCEVHSSGEKKEARLLRLSCEKAMDGLGWKAVLPLSETVRLTGQWYREYYDTRRGDMAAASLGQIGEYCRSAKTAGLAWAGGKR